MPHNEKGFTIFIAEDDAWFNKMLTHQMSLNPDFIVKSFMDGSSVLKAMNEQPDLVTIDYRLPDIKGDELLKEIKKVRPETEIIVISEQDEIEVAVDLLKLGAADYIVKSKDMQQRLRAIINNVREKNAMRSEIKSLRNEVQTKYAFENNMIGNSPAMQNVYSRIQKATATNINVTITGETGTGKEVAAKAIHYNSKIKEEPFVAINMAAIPADLLESELFGHEKGAFTGAVNRRIGKFESAGKGTLFLDEIGEMDIQFQAKLLRVLQEREIVRVGSNTPIKIQCRIIVATNRDLKEEVMNGNFREDLYFRLLGLPIELPPLMERGKDVLLLARKFISDFSKENQLEEKRISEAAQKKIMSYNWPGNVRELKSVIELSVVMSSGDTIEPDDISLVGKDVLPEIITEEMSMREYNRRIVSLYLEKYNRDTALVAKKLDIGQTTVYRLINEMKED